MTDPTPANKRARGTEDEMLLAQVVQYAQDLQELLHQRTDLEGAVQAKGREVTALSSFVRQRIEHVLEVEIQYKAFLDDLERLIAEARRKLRYWREQA